MPMSLDSALETTRALARSDIAERASVVDHEAQWPEENLRALQKAGLGGLVVPVRDGGMGLGLQALAQTCEELGRFCSSTAMCWGMHHVATAVLAAKATEQQRERYLRPIAAGQHLTTLALSEPGTGSAFYIPETQLSIANPGFLINGHKSFVTNGGRADSYVTSTAAQHSESPGEFSCIVIDHDTPGVTWGAEWAGLGMRGNSSREMHLRDAQLPRENLLGEVGDQIWYVFHVVAPYFLTAMSGTYIGVAEAALDLAVAHVKERRHSHSPTPIAGLSVVQHRVGEMYGRVARARALMLQAAAAGDNAAPDALPLICSTKAEAADCAVDVTNEAMSLLGGRGYGADSPAHRLLRDARAAHVMAPTTDLLRLWVGRALLGLPLLAD